MEISKQAISKIGSTDDREPVDLTRHGGVSDFGVRRPGTSMIGH